jgi:hypothetical protein
VHHGSASPIHTVSDEWAACWQSAPPPGFLRLLSHYSFIAGSLSSPFPPPPLPLTSQRPNQPPPLLPSPWRTMIPTSAPGAMPSLCMEEGHSGKPRHRRRGGRKPGPGTDGMAHATAGRHLRPSPLAAAATRRRQCRSRRRSSWTCSTAQRTRAQARAPPPHASLSAASPLRTRTISSCRPQPPWKQGAVCSSWRRRSPWRRATQIVRR